jgi:peptidoglycan/LPS O-acetylase OafA/YrhL
VSQASAGLRDSADAASAPAAVDNTDWLKTAAIIFVSVDHFGHFFMDDDHWWGAFGRLAAPSFFFLMGYAQRRTVPLHWIWLGVVLTLLNSWNANWRWVAPNILLSLAFIRFVRPYADALVQRYGWVAFIVLVGALVGALPIAAEWADYGSEGWLWALFGLCQRRYVDAESPAHVPQRFQAVAPYRLNANMMRLLACLIAAVVYVWQEQKEFFFPPIQLAAFVVGLCLLCLCLLLFRRGASRMQPPQPLACTLRFIGRHTLEIYAIQLAGSELIAKFLPDLVP